MEGGKWGLVIILAAFMIQVLAFGVTSTVGVYNIDLLDYFDGATVGVSLIGSINYGVFLGSGPIVSFLMTRFSYRKIALFGSVLVVIGLLGMPILPYIPAMCVCFGLLTGFGSSCAYIPSHVLSGLYYDKHRSLATGVATSGSGLGGAIMPIITGVLIEYYTWKGSLIFVAGLCLHLIVFSALLREPPPLLMKETSITHVVPLNSKSAYEAVDVSKAKKIPNSSRHIYIFTNYGFDVYFASNIMWNAGTAIVNAFVPEFLTEKGLSPMEAAWYAGIYGFGCFVGGVLGGVFGNFRWVNRQVLYTASNIVMGVSLSAFPYFEQKPLYLVFLIISGIAFGIILGLLIVVLTDLIGVESLGNGLGYLMLSNGLGTFIGPPVAGLIKEATGSFKEAIVLSGVLCVFGGLIMILMPCRWNCCSQKKTEHLVYNN
ncbi:unnamed protein product [Candidula unifasciata]|uniref:Major facilitator superfamily (MFS) profile domain-containing protein n=1 Tax=Candidula unifasciata TaxID=100452 RepID=A0A8S3YJS9_9EUPU|nr:unnamed protein product [Candidula unifasciata]